MRYLALLAALAAAISLTACTDTETYPLTGEPCGPDDPVKQLDARDCTPL